MQIFYGEADIHYLLSVLVSAAAGLLLSVIVRINATLGTEVGTVEATFIVHLVGTTFALLTIFPWLGPLFWGQLARRPWIELSGGVLSVAMVLIANHVVPVLGTALAVSLFVTGDLFFSSVADQTGWMDVIRVRISVQRILGLLLALAGVLLIHWG